MGETSLGAPYISTFLFAMPSAASGVGSLVYLGGTEMPFNNVESPQEADVLASVVDGIALRSDYDLAAREVLS